MNNQTSEFTIRNCNKICNLLLSRMRKSNLFYKSSTLVYLICQDYFTVT